jgi:galactokinase
MTGGGFGGAVVALLPVSEVDRVVEAVTSDYRTPAGNPPEILIERPSAGATLL